MHRVSLFVLLSTAVVPMAARAAATCPTGYITVDMPDVEIAATCEAGYTSAGTIDDCSTGAGVCVLADTCEAGYYLKDNACVRCKEGLSDGAKFYCPGDNQQYDCPTTTLADVSFEGEPATWMDEGWTRADLPLTTSAEDCYITFSFRNTCGRHNDIYRYSNTTKKYEFSSTYGYASANSGCYLASWKQNTGTVDWYNEAKPCTNAPANAHYTGAGDPDMDNCPWECDAGYGRHGDTCEPLCTAGATQLHVGPHTFNLYPDEACERPAIHIGLPGGTCCAHLVPGEGTDALHVRYNNEVYHTTN